MLPSDEDLDEFKMLVGVCGFLSEYLDKGTWQPEGGLEDVVLRTLARGRGTFETIVDLVAEGRSLQAAMLGRSLFEDMVVAHWLVLHHDDPAWLLKRFADHSEAMRLHDAEVRAGFNFAPVAAVADIADRAKELKAKFGKFAERDWWGVDESGQRITMVNLVERLADEPMFYPRLKGEQPILDQYFRLQQKAWTQALHHTAVGMDVFAAEDGTFPVAVARPSPALILFGNYWVFGQLIFVALDLAAPGSASEHFEKQFLAGLLVFGEVFGLDPPDWAGQIEDWAAGDGAG